MPRPRRPFSGQETIVALRTPFMEDIAPGSLGVRQRARWQKSTDWSYRVPNGVYDPLTYLLLLDTVAGIEQDIELRAANLAEYLNRTVRQFHWDPVTVGKVLADFHETFEALLGVKNGLLESGKDYRGAFYVLHRDEDVARVYRGLREDLMKLAADDILRREAGNTTKWPASPLLECPTARGEWVEDVE